MEVLSDAKLPLKNSTVSHQRLVMKNITTINNTEVVLSTNEDTTQVFTDTRAIAKVFDKRNADVMKSVDELLKLKPELNEKLRSTTYIANNGKENKTYELDRDMFSLVVLGFTGAKALDFKLSYINAFNMMEENIREYQTALLEAKFEAKLIENKKCNIYDNGFTSVRGVKQHLGLTETETFIWEALEAKGLVETKIVPKQVRFLSDDVPAYIAESRGDHNSPIFNPEAIAAIVNNYNKDLLEANEE